jgi:hypothetical protein
MAIIANAKSDSDYAHLDAELKDWNP